MYGKFVWRSSIINFSILFSISVLLAWNALAQKPTAPALEPDRPRPPSSGSYTPDPPPEVEYYIPPVEDFCGGYANQSDPSGCYGICESRSVDGKTCSRFVIHIVAMLHRPDPSSFVVNQQSGESSAHFFDRYNAEAIEAAIRAGADPNSERAKNSLLSAIANGNDEMAKRLINAGTKIDYYQGGKVLLALSLYPANYTIQRRAALKLTKMGVNVDASAGKGDEYSNILLEAIGRCDESSAICGNVEFVRALIDSKVSLVGSRAMEAALNLSPKNNRAEIVKMLLAGRAPIFSKFLFLTGCDSSDSVEIVKMLIAAGIDLKNGYGDTPPIKYFKNQNCQYKSEIISVLKQAGSK